MNKIHIDTLSEILRSTNLKGEIIFTKYNDDGDKISSDSVVPTFNYSSRILSVDEREKLSLHNVAYRIEFIATIKIEDNLKGGAFIDDTGSLYSIENIELITNNRNKYLYRMLVTLK